VSHNGAHAGDPLDVLVDNHLAQFHVNLLAAAYITNGILIAVDTVMTVK